MKRYLASSRYTFSLSLDYQISIVYLYDHVAHDPLKTSIAPDRVYGAAYRILSAHVNEVQSYLNIREINGYSIQYTTFHPSASPSGPITRVLVYIGLPTNPQFLGFQTPQAVAEVIAWSKGPSGENKEYLFMLEEALEGLGLESDDEHVRDLARRVKGLVKEAKGNRAVDGAVGNQVENMGNEKCGEAIEETEKRD